MLLTIARKWRQWGWE